MNKPLGTDLRAQNRVSDERVRLDDNQTAGAVREDSALWADSTSAPRTPKPGRFDLMLAHARDPNPRPAPPPAAKAPAPASTTTAAPHSDAPDTQRVQRARRSDDTQRPQTDGADDAHPAHAGAAQRGDATRAADSTPSATPTRHARRAARSDDEAANDTLQLVSDSLNAAVPVTPATDPTTQTDATDATAGTAAVGGAGTGTATLSNLLARLQGTAANATPSVATPAAAGATGAAADASGSATTSPGNTPATGSPLPAALAALLAPAQGTAAPGSERVARFASTARQNAFDPPAGAIATTPPASLDAPAAPTAQDVVAAAAQGTAPSAGSDTAGATNATTGAPPTVTPTAPAFATPTAMPIVTQASDAGVQAAAATLASTTGWLDGTRHDRSDSQPARDDSLDVSGLGTLAGTALPGATPALGASDGKIATPPVHDAQFADAMGAKLAWIAERHIGHAEIALSPGNDGQTLNVRVHVAGEHVRAEFASADADVRQAITSHLPRLRELLSERGFTLADAQVGSQRQSPDSPAGGARAAQSDDADPTTDPVTVVSTVRAHDGLLDAFA